MLNVENRIQYMITFNSNVMIRNLFLLVVFLGCVSLRHVEAAIDIVPKPVKLVETDGRFDITSACSISFWITALRHKTIYNTVEGQSVVKAF